jgi:Holliday junction resolvase
MSAAPPKDVAHLLHEALAVLGWSADPQILANRLSLLHQGLPREDEFMVVASWLGRCKLIHKLDQAQAPSTSAEQFQVPDLLAVFDHEGKSVTVLVEVKSSNDRTLSFRADYRAKLLAYAQAVKLPLLIAWKHRSLWTLFDIDHMKLAKKNYNVDLGTALSESLLSALAGDFTYTLPRGTGVHLHMRKVQLLSTEQEGSQVNEEWKMVVDQAYHTDRKGKVRKDLPADVEALFFVNNLEERQEHTPTHVIWHFTVEDDENKFAHMALSGLLHWYLGRDEYLNWREVAGRPSPVPGVNNFLQTVKRAMHEGVVKYIFHLQPQTHPPFLGAP